MKALERIKYYCFNKLCNSSIYNFDRCTILEVPLSKALEEAIYCNECYEELVSKPILDLRLQLNNLIAEEHSLKSIIIDDDPAYHKIFKELFKNSDIFREITHYRDGVNALLYLEKNKNDSNFIPDLIFVDVNMPKMDAWEFLDEFENLYPTLSKKVQVYVISSSILPAYKKKLKSYKYVKGLINKPFDKNSLEKFLTEFKN